MDFIIVDLAEPGVTQPLGSYGRRWLCRDSEGVLHCTYNKYFATGPRWRIMHGYSVDNGDSWTLEEIPGAPLGNGAFAIDSSILVDMLGIVHLVYEYHDADDPIHILKHAYKLGGIWQTEDITSWTAGYSPTSAYASPISTLDSSGTIHIIFVRALNYDNFQVQYIQGLTGAWFGEITVVGGLMRTAMPQYRCLVCDANDVLHLIYSLSADRTKILERTGPFFGIESVIETFAFNVSPDDLCAGPNEIALGISTSTGGFIKRQPTGGIWQPAEAVFIPDADYFISDAGPVFSTSGKAGLVETDDKASDYSFKQRLWQKMGGVWVSSPYQSAPDQIEDSYGYVLSHLYPSHSGTYPGLLADNEIIMFREIYSDIIGDYGMALLKGIYDPPAAAKPAPSSLAPRLVAQGVI